MGRAYDPELSEAVAGLPVGADLAAHVRERPARPAAFGPGTEIDGVSARTADDLIAADGFPVRVDVFDPIETSPERRSAVLYVPGGGFVVEPQPGTDRASARLASILGVPIVMAHYRLAPEHPFPAALLDVEAAYDWIVEESAGLRIDPDRIGLLGDSAGGGLAAALSLRLRDRGGRRPLFQHLSAPMLDRRGQTPSMREFEDTPLWTGASARLAWSMYLGEGTDDLPLAEYASPALAESVAGLPPTDIVTCEFDPLRDEGIAFAIRLIDAGVPTELHHYPGTFHGSPLVRDAGISRRMARDRVDALRRALL